MAHCLASAARRGSQAPATRCSQSSGDSLAAQAVQCGFVSAAVVLRACGARLRELLGQSGRVAVGAYIEKRKEVARLRVHMGEIGEALEDLEPELARRQAAYAEFRRRRGRVEAGLHPVAAPSLS